MNQIVCWMVLCRINGYVTPFWDTPSFFAVPRNRTTSLWLEGGSWIVRSTATHHGIGIHPPFVGPTTLWFHGMPRNDVHDVGTAISKATWMILVVVVLLVGPVVAWHIMSSTKKRWSILSFGFDHNNNRLILSLFSIATQVDNGWYRSKNGNRLQAAAIDKSSILDCLNWSRDDNGFQAAPFKGEIFDCRKGVRGTSAMFSSQWKTGGFWAMFPRLCAIVNKWVSGNLF